MSYPPTTALRFPGERAPRIAVIANDERVTVLIDSNGRRSTESATGATVVPGERVWVACAGESWPAVVRRRDLTRGALVEEILTHSHQR
jgi:hypothetical protein